MRASKNSQGSLREKLQEIQEIVALNYCRSVIRYKFVH